MKVYKTIHLDVPCNFNKDNGLRDNLKQVIEIANDVFSLIKSNNCTDPIFVNKVLYEKHCEKYPDLLKGVIQNTYRYVCSECDTYPKLLKQDKFFINKMLLPIQSLKIEKAKNSTHFDAWLKLQKTYYPLQGLESIEKLKKIHLLDKEVLRQNVNIVKLGFLEKEQLLDNESFDRVIKHRILKEKDIVKYAIAYAFLKRDKKRWKFYVTYYENKAFIPKDPSNRAHDCEVKEEEKVEFTYELPTENPAEDKEKVVIAKTRGHLNNVDIPLDITRAEWIKQAKKQKFKIYDAKSLDNENKLDEWLIAYDEKGNVAGGFEIFKEDEKKQEDIEEKADILTTEEKKEINLAKGNEKLEQLKQEYRDTLEWIENYKYAKSLMIDSFMIDSDKDAKYDKAIADLNIKADSVLEQVNKLQENLKRRDLAKDEDKAVESVTEIKAVGLVTEIKIKHKTIRRSGYEKDEKIMPVNVLRLNFKKILSFESQLLNSPKDLIELLCPSNLIDKMRLDSYLRYNQMEYIRYSYV